MKKMLQMGMLSLGMLLSSCAYVQTHKNVEELGSYYEGQVLSKGAMELYSSGGQWYLSAKKARFKMSYPTVHDSVFRRNDYAPTFSLIDNANHETIYHRISPIAASVLMQPNGYFSLSALAEEISRTPGEWLTELPGAQRHAILADIAGNDHHYTETNRVPEKKDLAIQALGKLDFIVVDVPLTVAYNVAIPLMAPFVFFYEFLSKD